MEGVAHPSATLIDAARPALWEAIADDDAIRIRIAQSTRALRAMGIAPVRSPVESTFDSVCQPINRPTEEGYNTPNNRFREAK